MGTDSFTYTAKDADGSQDTATVTVTVVAPDNPVTAVDDANTTRQGVALTVAATTGLLANDTAPDGGKAAVAGTFATAQGGSVTIAADGGFAYTPAAGFTGDDSFGYTARDADGSTDAGTAVVTVRPPPGLIAPVDLDPVALGMGGFRIVGENQFDRAGAGVQAPAWLQ